ncbi:hypothetical protein QL285_048921 [Trifolium repens]|nr:hypothetical protein QL285_048921 [Trifolium repens]
MASNNRSDAIIPESEDERKKQKEIEGIKALIEEALQKHDESEKQEKKLDEEIKALGEELKNQQARLSELLSNGFQLANYYFVFQGVILTALCNRGTILKCSDRWFLATLSALAAIVNLFALVSIGIKYNILFSDHAKIWAKCNQLVENKDNKTIPNSNTPNDPQLLSSGQQVLHVDDRETKKRRLYFCICIIFFLSFAIIVFVGCMTFLCRDH